MYTREQAMADSKTYFSGGELEAGTFLDKYALKNDNEELLEKTPNDMHRRLAKELARIESKYPNPLSEDEIFEMLEHFNRVIPQGSPMAGIGNSYQVTSISNCLAGETKILTRKFGFIPISDVAGTRQELLTLGGGWVNSEIKDFGVQKLSEIKLSKGKGSIKTLYATPEHRWFSYTSRQGKKKEVLTKELQAGDLLVNQSGKGRSSSNISAIGIQAGFCYGDGSLYSDPHHADSLTIYGNKRTALGKYFSECYVSSSGETDYYSGIPNSYKELPALTENTSFLWGWLSGYFAADGHCDDRGACMFNSANVEDIVHVQNICGILGIFCSEVSSQESISNLTEEENLIFKVFINKNHLSEEFFIRPEHRNNWVKNSYNSFQEYPRWKVSSVTPTERVEPVFCAVVPDTHSFVIEGHILTGNCFVVDSDNSDSYGGIFQVDERLAHLMKRRAGVGVDLSFLRPSAAPVKNAARTSTGVPSFMERYSNTTREVAQEGRRGALMLSLDILHPDSPGFIDIKMDETKVTGANISIRQRDEFMNAVKRGDTEFTLRWPIDAKLKDAKVKKVINPQELWGKIIYNAWARAEPGNLFFDKIWEESIPNCYSKYGYKESSTNPLTVAA